jgi:hypothetical protein
MAVSLPTVDELMHKAFSPGREPRSAEYKRGVHDMLVRRIEGVRLPVPYDQASAQRDAYYSGWDEADAIWHSLKSVHPLLGMGVDIATDSDAQKSSDAALLRKTL